MLEIKKIKKIYETEDLKQVALNDVSVNFRKSEFASILGQSGSGKTTLLNIIGGLDQYNSGDLIINGVSTKKYKNRDWDSYRNHRVGFIFQSYNLIPHQTILSNVELALTLSGVSKKERIKRAKSALKEVGLEKHMNKKPNQLSGGQMQRVAIARALINDPDILLADEPTGALDTATSKQIMDLLKKVAKDKLVIMVTHNPELAEEYSTRIIKLSDGKIIADSNPFDGKDEEDETVKKNKSKKTNMSFLTAISLSFNNLLTKKGRTILTAFAGSIGIIGIALILSLSNGFQNYIDKIQEDTLTSYPLTIMNQSMDFSNLLTSMMEKTDESDVPKRHIKENQQFAEMFSSVSTNDLTTLKHNFEDNKKELDKFVKSISYEYSIDPVIYSKNKKNEIIKINPNSLFESMYGGNAAMSAMSGQASVFVELPEDMTNIRKNFEVVEGKWPEKYNEMVLVLPNKNTISDLLLYLIGIRDMNELFEIMTKVMSGEKVEIKNESMEFTYDDFFNLDLKLVNMPDLYKYNNKYKIYEDMQDDKDFVKKVYNNSESLKIVGIVAAKESGNVMNTGLAYTSDLKKHVIDKASKSDIVKKQLKDEEVDVFSNQRFDSDKPKSNLNFEDLITVDTKLLQSAFGMNVSESDIKKITEGYMKDISSSITADITPTKEELVTSFKKVANGYFASIGEGNTIEFNNVSSSVDNYMKTLKMDETYKAMYNPLLKGIVTIYIQGYVVMDSSLTTDIKNPVAKVTNTNTFYKYSTIIDTAMESEDIKKAMQDAAVKLTEGKMQMNILSKVGELTQDLMKTLGSSFNVDSKKIAAAFKFDLSESELKRLMGAMSTNTEANATTNLITLGYQDLDKPTAISLTFKSFEGKEEFKSYMEDYNKKADEEKIIHYTDATGILMSSVKTIVDSVSYVLIAFVSISLIVSSIMIGIITYISVLERTKEIGILRAIGASKHNISSIFNAETFIIGLLSGCLGIGVTLLLNIPINNIIHSLTDNYNINSVLPTVGGIVLVILSVILTLIGGIIPSRIASKKDPVEALRTE